MTPTSPDNPLDPTILGHWETILFIEDNPAMRELLERAFTRFNYHTLVAPTVEDAVHLWRGHQHMIQAVVSDCNLGHAITGLTLMRGFEQAEPGMVLILASGTLTPEQVAEVERTTTIKCLPKPFDLMALLTLLRDGLAARTRQKP